MTVLPKPHQGIELDTVDLSLLQGPGAPARCDECKNKGSTADLFVNSIQKEVSNNDSFLSFSSQINNINKILNMNYSSANDIADAIAKDLSLTTKLLKLVNSAFYGHLTGKGISSIAEAMIILGTEEIKMAAGSLKTFELMQNIGTIPVLKKKTLQALQRSILASQISNDAQLDEPEAIQIATMLYDFGQYLVALYYPGIFIEIELKAETKKISLEDASEPVMGLSYSELGKQIAVQWHLPSSITNAMTPVKKFDIPRSQLNMNDLKQYICAFVYELCSIEYDTQGEALEKNVTQICCKYQECLGIESSRAIELLNLSREKIKKHSKILTQSPNP